MAGYNWEKGKSNNAVWAEEDGMRSKSKITAMWLREGGVQENVGFIKWLIGHGLIGWDEWHHTSKFYNRTYYYNVATIREKLETLHNLDQWRATYRDPATRDLHTLTIMQMIATHMEEERKQAAESKEIA